MLQYQVNDTQYVLSYHQLREEYYRFTQMTDSQFLNELPAAAHLACVICFLKELSSDCCLCDKGIIHELIHLIHIPNENNTPLKDVRMLFSEILKLS